MKDFYITLLSNSSMDYYPSNKTNSFTVQIPKYLRLDGDWEVGLTEFQYPYTFATVEEDENKINLETFIMTASYVTEYARAALETSKKSNPEFPKPLADIVTKELKIPSGFYTSVENIVKALNSVILTEVGQKNFFNYDTLANRVYPRNNTVETGKHEITKCTLSKRLALQLGYPPDIPVKLK